MKIRIGIMFILISAFLTATGQLLWKIGINNIKFLPLGFLFYGFGSIFMIKSFEKEKLVVVYPIMCISYVISMFYGNLFLNETITPNKVLAVILIILGVSFNSYDK
ncbi:hypothetical protein CBE01nite_20970 [Clostridium beijerinckii]|uniref:EamA family transporter n=1 Tax=Clostridium beijerinckii TaxID=1520 RepID=A0AB74VGV4_CLOBE|nr:EamA family transporter [Clostridium beijerinckii]NOW07162.1 drug/metabolite transporter (DMT)-like permease [Clostridium beijerinckii]NRZ24757.1 drug/metabolite transporter (DMT)-like permease [Clostridium beijerinckii]NYB99029.1 drug/metabolite transporter (DMT)-like permease [Clostridium beijerinckii]NYC05064.1 drug/metabolite transporter (DMT)-like permease [Clostridium beijerinckii]OOM19441.1 4-amino-4-deoxy-L-arabinose-phosphoundecaprenol flippase subunit ArnE [Clostridium beijerincki